MVDVIIQIPDVEEPIVTTRINRTNTWPQAIEGAITSLNNTYYEIIVTGGVTTTIDISQYDTFDSITSTTVLTVFTTHSGGTVPHIVNIDDIIYLSFPETTTGTLVYSTTNGINWTKELSFTTTYALTSQLRHKIFKIGSDIFVQNIYFSSATTQKNFVEFFDLNGTSYPSDLGAEEPISYVPGCVDENTNKFLYVGRTGSAPTAHWYSYSFDGTTIVRGDELCSTSTTNNINSIQSAISNTRDFYYYKNGNELFILQRYIFFRDKLKASTDFFTEYDVGALKYPSICFSEYNMVSYIGSDDRVYKMTPSGYLVDYFSFTNTYLHGFGGWGDVMRCSQSEIYNPTTYYVYSPTSFTDVTIKSGKVKSSFKNNHCNLYDEINDWNYDLLYVIKQDDIVFFQGYVASIRDNTVKFISPIDQELKNTSSHSWSSDTTATMINEIVRDDCLWMTTGSISSVVSPTFTFDVKNTIKKHFSTAERLQNYVIYWNPEFEVSFDDGSTSLSKTYSQGDGKIFSLKSGADTYAISRVILETSDGTVMQTAANVFSGQTYIDFMPNIGTTEATVIANNIISRNNTTVQRISADIFNEGLIQWGNTISIYYPSEGVTTDTTFYVLESEYDFRTKICHIEATDALIYDLALSSFSESIRAIIREEIMALFNQP